MEIRTGEQLNMAEEAIEKARVNISRRSFLKGAAAAAAAVGMAAAAPAPMKAEAAPLQLPENCHYSWETAPDPIPEEDIVETIDAEVVVVGAGLAGCSAALRCKELGGDVVVVEKTSTCQGRGGHFGSINSKAWREAGVVNDKKEVVRDWIASCGNRAKEELVWLFANNSEEAMDWNIDKQVAAGCRVILGGARYTGDNYTEHYGYHMFVGGPMMAAGEVVYPGTEVVWNLHNEAVALGVPFYFDSPAEQLVKEDGRVVAVIANTPDGYKRFNASKGVILATGDIHGDEEMLKAYCPIATKCNFSQYIPVGGNTGDGHKMGLWVGGKLEDTPFPSMLHPQAYNRISSFFLFVNVDGKRFMNEDTWVQGKSLGVLRQPGDAGFAWSVFDSDYVEQMKAGMPYSGGLFNDNSSSVYGRDFTGEKEEGFLAEGLENGTVVSGETLEELAANMGVPVENLLETVARYNELVANGDDEDFGKKAELLFPIEKAPFYASKFGPAILVIVGGLEVDTRLRVLDTDNAPIPGLYAVGNVSGGLYGVDYPTRIPGNSHGRAITWGYLAGRNVLEDNQ